MEGTLIRLRRAHPGDTADRVRWFADPQVTNLLGSGVLPLTEAQVRSYLELGAASTDKHLEMAIEVKATGEHAGGCTLRNLEPVIHRCEFAIMIDRAHQGKGYGTEAARLMLAIAFGTLNMNRVWLSVHAPNLGAIRSYEKAGFVKEGLLRQHAYNNGEYRDVYLMGCLRSDWQQAKEAGW